MQLTGASTLGLLTIPARPALQETSTTTAFAHKSRSGRSRLVTLFLCGDVMTGRGIDQVLPYPSAPQLREAYVKSALGYVELAENANGPIPKPVDFAYVWGDALEEFKRVAPEVRIINLETAITTSEDWQAKGINYRMHPDNVPCLTSAEINCCVLANNHTLDWGQAGLAETVETLRNVDVKTAGVGLSAVEAEAPAAMTIPGKARVIVFAFGTATSGIPRSWAASEEKPGVNLLHDLSDREISRVATAVRNVKKPGDIVVASIHWGRNWGYRIPRTQRVFAHKLVDEAGVDIIHGHSSHHPKGIEVYKGKPILYGCGDFLNDYEGISGYEQYRSELVLMYFATMDASTRNLVRLEMTPLEIRRFRLNRVSTRDAQWLRDSLSQQSGGFGTDVQLTPDNTLTLEWEQ